MTSPPDESPARAADQTASPVTSSMSSAPAPPRRRRGNPSSTTAPPAAAPPAPSPPGKAAAAPKAAPPGDRAPAPGPTRRARRLATAAPAPAVGDNTEFVREDDGASTRRARRREANAARPRAVAAPRGERRFRQTLMKVDLWSVTKLALCFYVSAMFVTIVAMIALWMIADAAGIVGSVEKFLGDLLSAKDFKFLSGEVLRGTIVVGLVIVALQVVITVIAASFYNIFAELFGGLEIVVREEGEASR